MMIEQILIAAIPVILAPVVSYVRTFTDQHIAPKYIPILLASLGAAVSSAYAALGMPAVDFTALGADAWNGALAGLATTGIHQLFTQLRKPS